MLSHSFDTPGGVDFRLVRVPANPDPPSLRPVFGWDENRVPRFSGGLRGPIPAYDVPSVPASEPIGHIPQVAAGGTFGFWEAASGIASSAGVATAPMPTEPSIAIATPTCSCRCSSSRR